MLIKFLVLILLSSFLGLICGIFSQIYEISKKEKIKLKMKEKYDITIHLIFSKNIFEIFKPYEYNDINKIIKNMVLEQNKIKNKKEYSPLRDKNFKIKNEIPIIPLFELEKELKYINYCCEILKTKEEKTSYLTLEKVSFCIPKNN